MPAKRKGCPSRESELPSRLTKPLGGVGGTGGGTDRAAGALPTACACKDASGDGPELGRSDAGDGFVTAEGAIATWCRPLTAVATWIGLARNVTPDKTRQHEAA